MEIKSEITDESGTKITIVSKDIVAHQRTLSGFKPQSSQPPVMPSKPLVTPIPTPAPKVGVAPHTRYNRTELKQIRTLVHNGVSAVDISKILGRPYKSVWAHAHKFSMQPQKTEAQLVDQLRKRHAKKVPVYHDRCPCNTEGVTVADWLTRSENAKIERLRLELSKRRRNNPQ